MKKSCLLFLVFFMTIFSIKAAHIVGGEMTYKCKGISADGSKVTFSVAFTLYRDSKGNGAPLDNNISIGVYKGSANKWTWVNTMNVKKTSSKDIVIENNNPCILVPINVGVEEGRYNFDIVLDVIAESYILSHQRCCRNNSILNIRNAGDTGAGFTTEITPEAQLSCNNSPTFNKFPPVLVCVNRDMQVDHSAKDIEGDSLVYEFCSPLSAGGKENNSSSCDAVTPNPRFCPPPYPEVAFDSPKFYFDKPMAGNPVVSIDPKTGLISGIPTILGQYVVGVCVKEYRNGVLIGNLRRDFQFNVTTCEVAISANMDASTKTASEFLINSCGKFSLDFVNRSTDVRYIKDYYWEFDINGDKKTFTTKNCTVEFPGLGTYKGTMILNKNLSSSTANCSDTAFVVVNVFPSIEADYSFHYDTCVAGPIFFTDKSKSGSGPIQNWTWDFGEGKSKFTNPLFEYENSGLKQIELIVEDINKCKDTITKTVSYFPLPTLIVIEPNTFVGCQPGKIYFDNLTKSIDKGFTFNWDFGDGGISHDLNPTYTYQDTGTYTVMLELISDIGCKTSKRFKNLITIVESPKAGFTYLPDEPNILNNQINFVDTSSSATYFNWNFGDFGSSTLQNPSHIYRDTGNYLVTQLVLHPTGCTDTSQTWIHIGPKIDIYMPNAFTPNNDGLNDDFGPKGNFYGIIDYKLTVWNRWGDQVFETIDPYLGWNSQKNNAGELAPPGIYAFLVSYIDEKGIRHTKKGHCTLIR